MIITITPNPLLDFIIHNANKPESGAHRQQYIPCTVGGKGINVARMLKTFGRPALAITFAGGPNGQKIKSILKDQGIIARFIQTNAETRMGINFVVSAPPSQSWWIEDGNEISESEITDMLNTFAENLPKASYIVLSGTIPGKRNHDLYKRVLEKCIGFSAEIIIDARGEPLRKALEIGGFFLKQNRDETLETFGLDPFNPCEWPDLEKQFLLRRLSGAFITNGREKAVLWISQRKIFFVPPPILEVSAVGSGDAASAGFVYARSQGMDLIEAGRWAIASGTADALHPGPCEAGFDEIVSFLRKVESFSD